MFKPSDFTFGDGDFSVAIAKQANARVDQWAQAYGNSKEAITPEVLAYILKEVDRIKGDLQVGSATEEQLREAFSEGYLRGWDEAERRSKK